MSIAKLTSLTVAIFVFFSTTTRADLSATDERAVVGIHVKAPCQGTMEFYGTGFFVGPNLLIMANHMTYQNPDSVHVYQSGSYIAQGHVITGSQSADSVLVKLNPDRKGRVYNSPVWLDLKGSNSPVGTPVRAYGDFRVNPIRPGKLISMDGHILRTTYPEVSFDTTSCPWYSGYSGGPVIDRQTNEVVGMISGHQYDTQTGAPFDYSMTRSFVMSRLFKKHLQPQTPQPRNERRTDKKPQEGGNTTSRATGRVHELSQSTFDKAMISGETWVVEFGAPWCGPCKATEPVIHKLASENVGRIAFGKVNTDVNQSLSRKQKVNTLPTIVIYRDGREIARTEGKQTERSLMDFIKQ